MDTPSNGGRDSRFNLNHYEMPILTNDSGSELYNSNILHNRPTSITSTLSKSSNMNNSCASGIQRGLKRISSDMCYDPNMSNRTNMIASDCGSDIIEDTYSPSHQKNSPLSNGKKTKGRVKIKMEYIDNKLRRYTTFSKRKTGIMKKAYELSTLTGTQVMLLVASETGHVYTFATRKLQPMITSETGKALIQTCLNSPDPCPSGSGDQRMSATGFEETELSYNIGDDDKVDASPCSPYRSDSSDSSDVESVPASPASSPPPLISLQDFQASTATTSTSGAAALTVTAVTKGPDNKIRCVPLNSLRQEMAQANGLLTEDSSKPSRLERCRNRTTNGNSSIKNSTSNNNSSSSYSVAVTPTTSSSGTSAMEMLNKNGNNAGGLVFTLEQLQREFGLHITSETGALPQYITIPMLSGITNANTNPPAAHQTPADLSNRSRK